MLQVIVAWIELDLHYIVMSSTFMPHLHLRQNIRLAPMYILVSSSLLRPRFSVREQCTDNHSSALHL